MSETSAPEPGTYPGPFTMQPAYYGTCAECGRAVRFPHECPPWYRANWQNHYSSFRAVSAEEAAEMFVRQYDQNGIGNLTPLAGCTLKVKITDEAGRVTWWEVSGRVVPEYMAFEVEG